MASAERAQRRTATNMHCKYLVVDDGRAWIGTPIGQPARSRATASSRSSTPIPLWHARLKPCSQRTGTTRASLVQMMLWCSAPPTRAPRLRASSPTRNTGLTSTEELNDQAVSNDLQAAVHRGVKVRLVTTVDDKIGSLAGAIPTVVRLSRLYVHAKAIIADGKEMYVGSENFSATSLDSNREMGLIITDPAIILQVEATFAGDVGGPARTAASGQAVATATSSRATTPTTYTSAATLSVVVHVSPNPIPYGSYPGVTISTAPEAVCAISVRYGSGKGPTSYPDHTATANASGTIVEQGRWHMQSKSAGGTVTASCSSKGATATGSFSFQIG